MRRVLPSAALILGACATQGEPVTIHQVPPGSKCIQSSVLQSYVGELATAELSARLMAASQARTVRWVPHGTMITMEHSETRLTVWLGPDNRIQRLNCG
jgi:hypothetical protein